MHIRTFFLLAVFGFCTSLFGQESRDVLKAHVERMRDLEYAYLVASPSDKIMRLDQTEHEIGEFERGKFGRDMQAMSENERLFLNFRRLKEASQQGDIQLVEKYSHAIETIFKSRGKTPATRWYVDGKISPDRLVEFIEKWDKDRLAEIKIKQPNQTLQRHDHDCHDLCVRTGRASHGRG